MHRVQLLLLAQARTGTYFLEQGQLSSGCTTKEKWHAIPQHPLTAPCPSVRGGHLETLPHAPWSSGGHSLCRLAQLLWVQDCGVCVMSTRHLFTALFPNFWFLHFPLPPFQTLSESWGSDRDALLRVRHSQVAVFSSLVWSLSVVVLYGTCGWSMHTLWYHPILSVFRLTHVELCNTQQRLCLVPRDPAVANGTVWWQGFVAGNP